jgi:hypothetical protein
MTDSVEMNGYIISEYEPTTKQKYPWGGWKCSAMVTVGPFQSLAKLDVSNIDKKWGGKDQNKLLDDIKSHNGINH